MARNLTISRDELGLTFLDLHDPDNGFYMADDWASGGIEWERYNAAPSPFVNGDRVIGQRKTSVEEVFTIYVHASTPAGLKAKMQTVIDAFSQFRYTFTISWDGADYTFNANGAANVKYKEDKVDPVLHMAGWVALEITIPREPGIG